MIPLLVTVPPGAVTLTPVRTDPAVPEESVAVICVDETTLKLLLTPPILTLVAPVKLVPLIVTVVPATGMFEVGDALAIVGAAKVVRDWVPE